MILIFFLLLSRKLEQEGSTNQLIKKFWPYQSDSLAAILQEKIKQKCSM